MLLEAGEALHDSRHRNTIVWAECVKAALSLLLLKSEMPLNPRSTFYSENVGFRFETSEILKISVFM